MQFSVENKRQVFLRVVFGSQVTFFQGAIRRNAIARVVDPANDVVEVGLLSDALKVRGKVTADRAGAFADRVTGKTAACFKQFLSVTRVSAWLSCERVSKTVLPQVGGDRFELIARVFVAHVRFAFSVRGEAPERRHLGPGSKLLWVLQPDRHPLLTQFHADIFEVWSNLLLILHHVLRLQVQLIDTRGEKTVRDTSGVCFS